MEVQDTIPCSNCPRTMVKVGAGRRGEELVQIHYHCPRCHTQLIVDAKTGEHQGPFTQEILGGLEKSQTLRVIGSTALPGDKYPNSRIPKAERR